MAPLPATKHKNLIKLFLLAFQMSSSEVDHSIDQTLGNFLDAAKLFETDTKQFIGITPYPTTPITTRPMPPLAYTQPTKVSSASSFGSNGITSSQSVTNNSSRPYNNNSNSNNTAISNVNSYQQKTTMILAPPPQSRANNAASNNSTFVRPNDNKPLINGRPGYPTASQPNKHEVIIDLKSFFFSFHCTLLSSRNCFFFCFPFC